MSKFEVRQRERDEARKAAVVARRLEKEKESRTEETSEYFTEHFSLQKTGTCVCFLLSSLQLWSRALKCLHCQLFRRLCYHTRNVYNIYGIIMLLSFGIAIEGLLEIAKSLPKDGLSEHFDLISKDCHSLQRLVSDATLYLTSFELRTAQEVYI